VRQVGYLPELYEDARSEKKIILRIVPWLVLVQAWRFQPEALCVLNARSKHCSKGFDLFH